MALTKQTVVSELAFDEFGVLRVRTSTRVLDDDGSLIGEKYHRAAFPPSADFTTVPAGRLRQHAQIEWTPAVIAAWQARVAAMAPQQRPSEP